MSFVVFYNIVDSFVIKSLSYVLFLYKKGTKHSLTGRNHIYNGFARYICIQYSLQLISVEKLLWRHSNSINDTCGVCITYILTNNIPIYSCVCAESKNCKIYFIYYTPMLTGLRVKLLYSVHRE